MNMVDFYSIKEWLGWPLIRVHLCTFAVSLCFNSTWRAPREAYRYGGLQYGLLTTVIFVLVALPTALLQLAVGQLSQQDAVGIWRAVPFFKGLGYLRLLTSFIGSLCAMVYTSLCFTYFLYTLSHSIPFPECIEDNDASNSTLNASQCLNETFMSPISESPEYFIALIFIVLVMWLAFSFILYNPTKMTRRMFYILGPLVFVLMLIVLSATGEKQDLSTLTELHYWSHFTEPQFWSSAVAQVLLSSQLSGGYLIVAGGTIYSNTSVQWTSLAFVATNMVSNWFAIVFWFAIGGTGEKNTSPFTVLLQIYQIAEEKNIPKGWSVITLATLFFSGIITMVALLYPLYYRIHRVGGPRWRVILVGSSVVCAILTLAALGGRSPILVALDDVTIPFLVIFTTIMEMFAFLFVYGSAVIVEDIEFLIGNKLSKYWVCGWFAAVITMSPLLFWWIVTTFTNNSCWIEPPWECATMITSITLAILVFVVFAGAAVGKQVQYDIFGKIRTSFEPSRHWGPRDPITHYYWLAKRQEHDGTTLSHIRYMRRQPGQMSGSITTLNHPEISQQTIGKAPDRKRRTNSDDWLFTAGRKIALEEIVKDCLDGTKKRSVSLDRLPVVKLPKVHFSTELVVRRDTTISEYMTHERSTITVQIEHVKM